MLAATAALRREEVAAAEAAVAMAEHDWQLARAALEAAGAGQASIPVRAPMDATVLRVQREDEGMVAAGTPLLELGDPATLEVVVDVLSEDAVRLVPGARATVSGWGGPPVAAHVARIEPAAFTKRSSLGVEEQRVTVRLRVDAAADTLGRLGDGYRVEATIEVASAEAAVAVPSAALLRTGDGWSVYRLRQGTLALVPVSLGLRGEPLAEVGAGLAPGDTVVVYPPDGVAPGRTARARVSAP